MTREISQREINQLLAVQPDPQKYPEAARQFAKKPHEHHFFQLLGGNPQAIILIAPLLADYDKQLTLKSLYQMLTQNQVQNMLADDLIEEKMLASLHVCIQISVQILIESDPICLKLFFLLGMLPGGSTEEELNYYWSCIKEPTPWHLVITQLEKYKLVERRIRQSTGEQKIFLAKFVSTFADAFIQDSQKDVFHKIIVTQMHRNLSQWYQQINNIKNANHLQDTETIKKALVSCEQNLWSVIQRMSEQYATGSANLPSIHSKLNVMVEDMDGEQCISEKDSENQDLIIKLPQPITEEQKQEWESLKQATEKVSIEKRQLEVINAIKNLQNQRSVDPRSVKNPAERARLWWRLALQKIKCNKDQYQRTNIQIYNQDQLESDSTDPESPGQQTDYCFSPIAKKRIKSNMYIFDNIDGFPCQQTLSTPKIKTLLRTQTANTLQFHKRIKDIQRKFQKEINFTHKHTETENNTSALKESSELMTVEEQLICYYIFSLTLLKQCVIVLRLIKKFLCKFTACSKVFIGNVMRAKAICCIMLLDQEKQDKAVQDFSPVNQALTTALELFHECNCSWGLGLTQFQLADLKKRTLNFDQAKKHYIESIKQFSQINHFRGISMCYKSLNKLLKSQKRYDEGLAQNYWDEYLENMAHWRTSQSHLSEYLSISRCQGEEFSLQCEIVLLKSCLALQTFKHRSFSRTLKHENTFKRTTGNIEEQMNESFASSSFVSESLVSQSLKRFSQRSFSSQGNLSSTQSATQSGGFKHSKINPSKEKNDLRGLMLESNTSNFLSRAFQNKKYEIPNIVLAEHSMRSQEVQQTVDGILNFDQNISPIKQEDYLCVNTLQKNEVPLMSMTLTYKPKEYVREKNSFSITMHRLPSCDKQSLLQPVLGSRASTSSINSTKVQQQQKKPEWNY